MVRTSFEPIYLVASIYRGHGIEKFIRGELKNRFSPYKYFVITDMNDMLLAFAEFKNSVNTEFLNMIVTAKGHKNSGLANFLLKNCNEFFLKNGTEYIELDVFKSNLIAVKWYNKLGFNEIGKQFLFKARVCQKKVNFQENFQILNYPQFSFLFRKFGFSFLELSFQNQVYKIGAIEDYIILRGVVPEELVTMMAYFRTIVKSDEIYFLTQGPRLKNLSYLDTILRLRLNLR
jgi:hypothetical protein